MENLFEKAISNNELLNFALGKNEYLMLDRDYGIHSPIIAWTSHIIPLLEKKSNEFVNDKIEDMFKAIVMSENDNQTKSQLIINHLFSYYYLNSEKRIVASKLKSVSKDIKQILKEYLTYLKENDFQKYNSVINTLNTIQSRGSINYYEVV